MSAVETRARSITALNGKTWSVAPFSRRWRRGVITTIGSSDQAASPAIGNSGNAAHVLARQAS